MPAFDINTIKGLEQIRALAAKYKKDGKIPDSEKDLQKAFLDAKAKYYMDETVSPDYFEKRILGVKKAEKGWGSDPKDLARKLEKAGINPDEYKEYAKQYKDAAIARDKGEEYEFPELDENMTKAIREKLKIKAPKPVEGAILADKKNPKTWLDGRVTESTLKSFDRAIENMKEVEQECQMSWNDGSAQEPSGNTRRAASRPVAPRGTSRG